ncbi:hypothetical protein M2103_001492 [Ereboglobus sp. PH5-5]|uniref:hypothetical protein n=1 Tax=Ereboglobus sp. PH5-5 TaxID=2940529 RepID=UPI002404EC66|nr:hypothetical protein [Ereboglobus sp. PH5-5]MDF9833269.1 hypothetical protein [Ereboglobus sp. PH5-5]
MKVQNIIAIALFAFVALLFAGCSTTSGRIKKNQPLFDSFPAEVQSNIRAGKVDIGYTPDMVLMALGEPDRRYTRTTERGNSEVWAYRSKAPAISFGLGVGGGGRTSVGTGVGISTGGDRSDDKVRVIFENDRVASLEQAK